MRLRQPVTALKDGVWHKEKVCGLSPLTFLTPGFSTAVAVTLFPMRRFPPFYLLHVSSQCFSPLIWLVFSVAITQSEDKPMLDSLVGLVPLVDLFWWVTPPSLCTAVKQANMFHYSSMTDPCRLHCGPDLDGEQMAPLCQCQHELLTRR